MLDLHRLGVLRELAARGTVTAVADALAFSPSAVSQQLAALQREVGVELLERRGRRLVLTPAGRALVDGADAVFDSLERATSAAAAAASQLVGPVRIGSFASVGATVVPAALALLRTEEPGLEVWYEQRGEDGLDQLLLGHLDVWIDQRYTALPGSFPEGAVAHRMLDEPVCLAVPAGNDRGPSLERYRDAAWVSGTPGSACRRLLQRLCDQVGFAPQVRAVTDDLEVVLALVQAGAGVAVLPRLATTRMPDDVVIHPLTGEQRRVIALARGSAEGSPAVRCVLDALVRAGELEGAARRRQADATTVPTHSSAEDHA